ncbi:MAG: hypothetical protein AB7R89_05965 [Dehalococcoidia bacterium]
MTATEILTAFLASHWGHRRLCQPLDVRVQAFLTASPLDGGLGMGAPDAATYLRLYEGARLAERKVAA